MTSWDFAGWTGALAATGQPGASYQAFDALCARCFGHRLFTILAWDGAADEVERVYSSRPSHYPVSARKRMGPTPWGQHVLKGGRCWLGSGVQDMQWAFPDHQVIAGLGCGACLNAPVRWNGRVLGAVNVLDAEGAYQPSDLDVLDGLSGFLVSPLLVRAQAAGDQTTGAQP